MLEIDDEHSSKCCTARSRKESIGAAFEVHGELGYGFLERVYERSLQVELIRRGSVAETFPHMRLNAGYGDMFQRPSRFLKEISTQLVEDWQVRRN